MRVSKTGAAIALVALNWLWSAAPTGVSAEPPSSPVPPAVERSADDPEPPSCLLCGGNAELHQAIVVRIAFEGGSRALDLLLAL